MNTRLRMFHSRLLLGALTAIVVAAAVPAQAAIVSYTAVLNGSTESPPVVTAGTGTATLDVDAVAHTMHLNVTFSGLTGNTTAAHIHAATAVAFAGNAGVATTTPYFAGFPIGVQAGTYDITLDMTQASSFNASYITAHGGTTAQAEADLFAAIAAGKAYLNIHSTFAGGGEIRGFWVPAGGTPAVPATWGLLKSFYR